MLCSTAQRTPLQHCTTALQHSTTLHCSSAPLHALLPLLHHCMPFYFSTASLHCITPHIAAPLQHCSAAPPCSTPLHCLTNSSTPFHSITAPLRDLVASSLLCTTALHNVHHCITAPQHYNALRHYIALRHHCMHYCHCITPLHHCTTACPSTSPLYHFTASLHHVTASLLTSLLHSNIAALYPPAALHFIA
jgi:hypothetical protein